MSLSQECDIRRHCDKPMDDAYSYYVVVTKSKRACLYCSSCSTQDPIQRHWHPLQPGPWPAQLRCWKRYIDCTQWANLWIFLVNPTCQRRQGRCKGSSRLWWSRPSSCLRRVVGCCSTSCSSQSWLRPLWNLKVFLFSYVFFANGGRPASLSVMVAGSILRWPNQVMSESSPT